MPSISYINTLFDCPVLAILNHYASHCPHNKPAYYLIVKEHNLIRIVPKSCRLSSSLCSSAGDRCRICTAETPLALCWIRPTFRRVLRIKLLMNTVLFRTQMHHLILLSTCQSFLNRLRLYKTCWPYLATDSQSVSECLLVTRSIASR